MLHFALEFRPDDIFRNCEVNVGVTEWIDEISATKANGKNNQNRARDTPEEEKHRSPDVLLLQ